MSTISLVQNGVDVQIVDIDSEQRVLGSELALSGPMLRSLASLGVAERCAGNGVALTTSEIGMADGTIMASIPQAHIGPADLPPAVGITRRALHDALLARLSDLGVEVQRGITVQDLRNEDAGVEVTFTDGSTGDFDLVVGADGVRSALRDKYFTDVPPPRFTGQSVWRAKVPRLTEPLLGMYYGPGNKAGLITVSDDWSYLFSIVNTPERERIDPLDYPTRLRSELEPYGGVIADAREAIGDPTSIHYSALLSHVMPGPWFRGRILLIGDAAHATTPHLAYGAGLAIEDGVVIGEAVGSTATVQEALDSFMARRYERCRVIVENGWQLGEWEIQPVPEADPVRVIGQSLGLLAQPI